MNREIREYLFAHVLIGLFIFARVLVIINYNKTYNL